MTNTRGWRRRLRRGSCLLFRSPRRPPLGRAAYELQGLERFRRLCRRRSVRAARPGREGRTRDGGPARPRRQSARRRSQIRGAGGGSFRGGPRHRLWRRSRRDTAHEFGKGSLFPVAEKGLSLFSEDRGNRSAGACLELEIGMSRKAAATGRPRSALRSTCRSHDSRPVPIPDPSCETRRREVVCHSWRIGESLYLRATTITSMGAS